MQIIEVLLIENYSVTALGKRRDEFASCAASGPAIAPRADSRDMWTR